MDILKYFFPYIILYFRRYCMKFSYETDRLLLKILDGSNANDVLRFYDSNREIFEQYEAMRPSNFYTLAYQRRVLNYEFNSFIKQTAMRFWIYEKTDPMHVIGTVCFGNIVRAVYQRCEVGYKLDHRFWHRGYAEEALFKCILIAFYELNLHRISAYIMPNNHPSIRLVERVGFEHEGIAKGYALVRGTWEDHLVYSILHP